MSINARLKAFHRKFKDISICNYGFTYQMTLIWQSKTFPEYVLHIFCVETFRSNLTRTCVEHLQNPPKTNKNLVSKF